MTGVARLVSVVLVIACCGIFITMGCWQLSRYEENKQLAQQLSSLSNQQAKPLAHFFKVKPHPWQKVTLSGRFIVNENVLLAHQVYKGVPGYHLLALFLPVGSKQFLLVDRGFVSKKTWLEKHKSLNFGVEEHFLPLTGVIYYPSHKGFVLGKVVMQDKGQLVAQKIAIKNIAKHLEKPLFPFVVLLLPKTVGHLGGALPGHGVNPLKNLNYAIQWFLFALVLVVGVLIYNRKRS